MDRCCIVGCFNRPTKRGELKFYTIPTANSSRPFKVKRRQLWLNAIEKANGDISDLRRDARICSAHFISGQLSLEMSDPDFAPSVFPNQLLRSREGTRNERRPNIASTPKASNVTPKKKAQGKQGHPQELLLSAKSSVIFLMENEHCKPLEDEDIHDDKDKIQQTSEVETTIRKKPVLLLKSVVGPPGWFRCDFCNDHFSNSSVLVNHIRRHDEKKSSEERLFTTSAECDNSESNLPGEEIQEEEILFKCNMCDRSFPTIHNLKRHKLLHVRDPRKCSQCGTLFCKRHNHVVVQPQISKETIFEEATATNNTMIVSNESQTAEISKSDSAESDEDSSDESTYSMDTTAQQSETATHAEPVPAVTCNPRKPQLLTAYMSFLSEKPKEQKSWAQPVTSTKSVESTQLKSPTKDLTAAQPTPEAPTQPETSATANPTTITTIAATTQPSPLQPLIRTKPNLQPALTNDFQKIEKSTVCLSFSKPLPSNVLKDFVAFISKSEGSKSTTPRLITFQAVTPPPENQKPPTDLTQPKPKLFTVPITLASLPKLPPGSSNLIVKRTELGTNVKIELASKPGISPTISSVVPTTPDMKKIPTPIKHAAPQSSYVHSARPPSPVPVPCKKLRGSWETPPNYPKDFVQPHLPQTPELPPALQMFSPQFLTSVMLDVNRNYKYILSNIE